MSIGMRIKAEDAAPVTVTTRPERLPTSGEVPCERLRPSEAAFGGGIDDLRLGRTMGYAFYRR